MTIQQKKDIVLKELYKYKFDGRYYNIVGILRGSEPVSLEEASSIGRSLDSNGYIKFSGSKQDASAKITAEGVEYVEASLLKSSEFTTQDSLPKNENKKNEAFLEETDGLENDDSANIKVFISYSWDTQEHEDKVFNFVNHLRAQAGFDAQMDKGLSQQETAINFIKMMHQSMHKFPKIIVILSEGYKRKADCFTGGVGTEYELMISDINDHPNKYILASFDGRDDNIIPTGFKGRDIVDLSNPVEMSRLYEKLMDHQPFVFADVAKTKPKLPVRVANPFVIPNKEEVDAPQAISITPFIKATGDASLSAKKYRFINFSLKFEFVNTTTTTIDGFNYIVKLPRELNLDNYHDANAEGFINYERSYNGKMFRGQRVETETFLLRVEHQNIMKIMKSVIYLEVFTEDGPIEQKFSAMELIKIKPNGENYREAVPLSPDLFI